MAKKITSKKKSPKTKTAPKKKNPVKPKVVENVPEPKSCWITVFLKFLGVK
jgi:hypothetical protein